MRNISRHRLLPVAIAAVVFFTLLWANLLGRDSVYRLSFPWAHAESAPAPESGLCWGSDLNINTGSCIECTLVAYTQFGFPFRANLYDDCSQDGDAIWYIQVVNFALILGFTTAMYLITKKLVQPRSPKKPAASV